MNNVTPIPHCLAEEIGLEGLDGITLEGLWKRLSVRLKLNLPLNARFTTQMWGMIREMQYFQFFELAEEREELKLYDRADLMDIESGMPVEPEECPYNDFKYNPISMDGIRGSCQCFETWKEIPRDEIRDLTLDAVEEKWGRKFVIVGTQELRSSLLIPEVVDPSIALSILHYCVLERLGRARYNGATTHGKYSLCEITRDPINFHYQKKILIRNKLIATQPFIQKIDGSNSTGQLLHLPRFYVEYKPKHILLTEKVIEILKSKPNYMAEYMQIKTQFDVNLHEALRKLFKMPHFMKFVATDLLVPFRTLYPDAPKTTWKIKSKDEEKFLKVIQLRDPNMEISEAWLGRTDEEADPDDGLLGETHEIYGVPLLKQAYDFIKSSESNGVSGTELGKFLGLGRLSARTVLRNLERMQCITTYACNEGRQKLQRYTLPEFKIMVNEDHSDTEEPLDMKSKNLDLMEHELTEDASNADLDLKLASIDNKTDLNVDVIQATDIEIKIEELQKTPFCMKMRKLNRPNQPLTAKMRHRYNLILRAVRMNGFISDPVKLFQMLVLDELKRGFKDKMCKKTFYRLLTRMCTRKQIRLWEIIFKYKSKFRTMIYISDANVDVNYPAMESRIEQAKKKFLLSLNMENINRNQVKDEARSKRLEITKILKRPLSNAKRHLNYGNTPKFVRMRTLHEFLYYIVYEHANTNSESAIPKETAIEHWKRSELHCLEWDSLLSEDLPPIYSHEIGWKMFVQPLIKYQGYESGWFLLNDMLYRLPLSIFVKLLNINYEIPGLDEILSHPIKKHCLVNSIPYDIQQMLFCTRKYISNIDDLLKRMCCMGLLQVGPHRFVNREEIYYFLNRNAMLLNTITSAPGYWRISQKEYPIVSHNFNSSDEISHYWDDLYKICTNTKLNRKLLAVHEPPVDGSWYRNENLLKSLEGVPGEVAAKRDCGYLPGDHLGAAGLDSSFFAHLLRNWSFKATKYKVRKSTNLPSNRKGAPIRYNRLVRITRDASVKNSAAEKRISIVPLSQLIRRRRRVVARKTSKAVRIRLTLYDDVDREALRRMNKLRVDWNSEEDNFLLLCRVAKLYLGVCMKRPLILPSVLRDLLQWSCKSMNKTSQACKRRITYILKKPSIVQSMKSCLEEVKQNATVQRRFGPNFATRLQKLYKDEDQFTLAIVVHYVDLVYLLSQKYYNLTNSSDSTILHIPGTIREFYNKFDVKLEDYITEGIYIENPQSQDDIKTATIVNLIHTTMCSSLDKTSWSIQLYEIYKDYEERLLSAAMKKVRDEQLISVNKLGEACHIGKVENRDLPLSAKPYHLSITYQHQMYTKISYDIFDDAFPKLRQIIEVSRKDRYQMISLDAISCFILTEMLHLGAFESHIEIPKQILILDPSKQTADNSSERIYARFQEIFNYIPKFDLVDVEDADHSRALLPESLPEASGSDNPSNTASLTKLSEQNFHFFCIINCFGQTKTVKSLLLNEDKKCSLTCILKQNNPISAIMKSLLTNRYVWRRLTSDDQCPDKLPEVIEIMDSNVLSIYNHLLGDERTKENAEDFKRVLAIVDEILEEEEKQEDDGSLFANDISSSDIGDLKSDVKKQWYHGEMINEKIHKFHDFLFVNSCKLSLAANGEQYNQARELLESCARKRDELLKSITKNAILGVKPDSDDEFRLAMVTNDFSSTEVNVGIDILNFIESHREIGATSDELKEKYEDKKFTVKVLEILRDLNLVNRCGVKSYIFVYHAYIQPWVVNTYNLKRLEREAIEPLNCSVMQISPENMDDAVPSTSKRKFVDVADSCEEPPSKVVKITHLVDEEEQSDTGSGSRRVSKRLETISILQNATQPPSIIPHAKKTFAIKLAPWIRINGSLNRRVLDKWMATILLYCIENAGVTMSKLSARFHFLLPIHIRDLLESLEEYGCIKTSVFSNRKTVTLFSSYEKIHIEPATYLDSFDEVTIEPSIDAITKMSIFIGDKKYKEDFV